MSEEFKLKLFEVATTMAHKGYSPENKGKRDLIRQEEENETLFTPTRVLENYKELLELFKDVCK